METPPLRPHPSIPDPSIASPALDPNTMAKIKEMARSSIKTGAMPSGDLAQRQIDKNAGALKSGLRKMGGKIVEVFSKLPMKYLVMTASAGFVLAMVVPVVLLLSTLLSGGGALVVVGLYVAMLVLAGSALVASVGASFMILQLVTGVGDASQQRDLQNNPARVESPIDEYQVDKVKRALAHEEALKGSGFESKPPSNPEEKRAEGEKKLDPPDSSSKPDRPRLKRSRSFSNNNPKAERTLKRSTSLSNLISQNIPTAAIPSSAPPDRTISVAAENVVADATAKVAEKTIEELQKDIEKFSAVFTEDLRKPNPIPASAPINPGHEEATEMVRVVLQVEQGEPQEPSQIPQEPLPVEEGNIPESLPVLPESPQAAAEQKPKIPVIKVRGVDLLRHLNSHTGPLLREYLEAQYNKLYSFPNKFRPLENIKVTVERSEHNLKQFAELLTIPEQRRLADHLQAYYSKDLNKKIA